MHRFLKIVCLFIMHWQIWDMLILPKEQIDSALYFSKGIPYCSKVHPKATSSALNDICYAYINKKDYISALKSAMRPLHVKRIQLTDITITLSKE